jgi:hypothetical protein
VIGQQAQRYGSEDLFRGPRVCGARSSVKKAAMADIASPLDLARQAIAAAKTAVDEGEAILRRTQERYRLRLHRAEAQAERPRLAKPKLVSEPELPEYVLTEADRVNVAAVVAMMKTAHAAKSEGLRKAANRDVGFHLQELCRDRHQAELATILWRECGLSLRRAYQLMATATGTKRLEQLRSEDRARHRKLKAVSPESLPNHEQRRAYG